MSYDIDLSYPDDLAQVENHADGGTYVLGGTTDASLNITYNYGRFYREHLDKEQGIRWLYNKKASETIDRLQKAVEDLGTTRDADYWKATPGNAGYALAILLSWARQHPEAVWSGD
jgi:hypothetical protein